MPNLEISFNGQSCVVTSDSLSELLKSHAIDISFVAVAINNHVIPSSEISKTHLKNGDHLEIVHAVCGG